MFLRCGYETLRGFTSIKGAYIMTQEKIDRINELARKAKTPEGLTPEETAERDVLRREYIDSFKRSLVGQLDNTYIQYPDGSKKKLGKKE